MITENLSTLKIHKLSQEQYGRAVANGNIDANALYLTPDEENVTSDTYVIPVNVTAGNIVSFDESFTFNDQEVINAIDKGRNVVCRRKLINNDTVMRVNDLQFVQYDDSSILFSLVVYRDASQGLYVMYLAIDRDTGAITTKNFLLSAEEQS